MQLDKLGDCQSTFCQDIVILWQYPTTKLSGSNISATISGMFYGFIVPSMLTNVLEELTIFAYKKGMIL